jgi:hypothetical protein
MVPFAAKTWACPLAVLDSAPGTATIANHLEESAMTGMQRRTYQKPTLSRRGNLPFVVGASANGG